VTPTRGSQGAKTTAYLSFRGSHYLHHQNQATIRNAKAVYVRLHLSKEIW